ncbi:DUF4286 family protein [Sphingobium nicotianae]|uniref:DUF4286 family protein n=1 Tax=Sphingobium nicotianae TaxID=2782607 RepID=A0A9X1IPH7_9SPHN|nr:DUF4286 family protein [Sphingobium nicotianae]MBT2186074.1 hypothetical protein [Sphingobium nicotianae]
MPTYKMVVFTNPRDHRDDEFNQWYDERHLSDLLSLPGMKTAERYKVVLGEGWRYLAIYDVETDDLDGLMTEMYRRVDDGEIFMSPAFDEHYNLFAATSLGPMRTA